MQALEEHLAPRERCTILWSYGKLRCYPGERLTDSLLAGPADDISQYEPVVRPHMCLHMLASKLG